MLPYEEKIYKYDNYEELVKDHYYVVPMAHEGSWNHGFMGSE